VPATSIIHYFTKERPGQGRGFPRIAPVISRVRDLSLYEDAEINRKNQESRLSVLASGDVNAWLTVKAPRYRRAVACWAISQRRNDGGPTGTTLTVVEPKASRAMSSMSARRSTLSPPAQAGLTK
jgi:hypothetical protein